ncbi:hypothetical protein [Streptomyces bluensis]|uniref:hypothetical protein n=1 Tax=Streptomyces bluensis TaxID=33897 RepID=UPI001674FFA8|nr:hypothetical protein [Streptomyces bluensis]GGZ70976.1 hypothetical protein GCM10010344_42140 [Streptomyces bluensis]
MPLLRRADWPRDHRDEVVAGALVGAVVIVLGYASGIGAPSASGAGEAADPPASPPAATAPPNPAPAPSDPEAQVPVGQVPVGTGELPVLGGGTGSHAGHGSSAGEGHGAGDGSGASPGGSASPSPSGSPDGEPPAGDDTCEDGEVRLVAPLLTGLTQPLFEVVNPADGTPTPQATADGTPAPPASPCVGLAPVNGLLGISASPLPEATP